MFGIEWREIAILGCVGAFWLLVLNRFLLGLRAKQHAVRASAEPNAAPDPGRV